MKTGPILGRFSRVWRFDDLRGRGPIARVLLACLLDKTGARA